MNALFLALIFAAWRVTDGGFHRHRYSTVVGWSLALAVGVGIADHLLLGLAIGLAVGRQLTAGYADWNDPTEMALRCWPTAALVLLLLAADVTAHYDARWPLLAVLGLVGAGNVVQPWLRARTASWGDWSNRTAEAIEGATVGAAMALV